MTTGSPSKKRSLTQLKADAFIKKYKKQYKNPIDPEDGTSQCISRVPVSMYVSLAPLYQQSPLEGIKRQHLNPMLMKYNADVGGVVLGYEKLTLMDANPLQDETDTDGNYFVKLSADTSFGFTWCSVEFVVWAPQVGDTLEGWIFIQSASHIGLLIHDAFNASIKKNSIPSNWEFVHVEDSPVSTGETSSDSSQFKKNRSLGHWIDEDGQQVAGKLKFVVKNVYTTGRMVSLEGTLLHGDRGVKSQAENLPVVSNTKIIFDDEVSQENKESHKDLQLGTVTEENGDEIVYEKDSSDSSSSDSD